MEKTTSALPGLFRFVCFVLFSSYILFCFSVFCFRFFCRVYGLFALLRGRQMLVHKVVPEFDWGVLGRVCC